MPSPVAKYRWGLVAVAGHTECHKVETEDMWKNPSIGRTAFTGVFNFLNQPTLLNLRFLILCCKCNWLKYAVDK